MRIREVGRGGAWCGLCRVEYGLVVIGSGLRLTRPAHPEGQTHACIP
jgi:hypothetical protein